MSVVTKRDTKVSSNSSDVNEVRSSASNDSEIGHLSKVQIFIFYLVNILAGVFFALIFLPKGFEIEKEIIIFMSIGFIIFSLVMFRILIKLITPLTRKP